MRAVLLTISAAVLLIPPAVLQASPKDRVLPSCSASTQTLSFDPRGVIQVEQSFGDMEIQGWDRPEVEITTIRSTTSLSGASELDEIAVTAVKRGEDRLRITTEFPTRKAGAKGMYAKTDADLRYVIKAPSQARLVVHHDIGQVHVSNFKNDIEVTNRVGLIGLRLARPEAYAVNATARIGDVSSVVGRTERRNVMGQQLLSDGRAAHPQLLLKVGVGDITIRKMW